MLVGRQTLCAPGIILVLQAAAANRSATIVEPHSEEQPPPRILDTTLTLEKECYPT